MPTRVASDSKARDLTNDSLKSNEVNTMAVATDERPLETPSSDESGLGRSTPDESEPEAALVVPPDGGWGWVVVAASFMCNVLVDGIIMTGGLLLPAIQKEFNVSDDRMA
ncbi:unnamed protein product [Plutella xylostella]|uniref:(diamondback moth) hypothetical protein n=1 Tax=Plutella xylostella TaxID=51655 RepID=A0A8S4G298_PLUXY|nr:unnamed protein product [Plutella xylostella]